MTPLLKQWGNSDLRETGEIICHSKGNDESFQKNVIFNENGLLNQKLWPLKKKIWPILVDFYLTSH